MAVDKQIKELNEQTSVASADWMLLQDISTDENKKVSVSTIQKKVLAPGGNAWQASSLTWGNLSIGNGVIVEKFEQIGKTVRARYSIVFGTTTTIFGPLTVALPATTIAGYTTADQIGKCTLFDTGTSAYVGRVMWVTSTTAAIQVVNAAGTYAADAAISATIPMTWTTGDKLTFTLEYEAA